MKDKDPFANTDAKPKDNVTFLGVITRYWFRKSGMIVWIPIYLIFIVTFGSLFYLFSSSGMGFLISFMVSAIHFVYRLVIRFQAYFE